MVKKENDQELVSVKKTILSMSFSLVLVAAVLLFIFGFRYFLSGREYKGANVQKEERKNDYDAHKEYLETDKSFKAGYIMIKNLPAKGLYISELPGKKENSSTYLKSGQILWASKKGTYEDKTYYHLKNGMYLYASEKYMEELASYEKLEGYVAITYISSTGVRLRKWADFQADNVVKSVYVGDKVQVKGKVTRKNGESAYITDKGLYLTVLRKSDKKALVYLCRPQRLEQDLHKPGVQKFLRACGYQGEHWEEALKELKERLHMCEKFPHEIGLFLDYPLVDVIGFIRNTGKNCKCSGCWKAYGNAKEAEKTFCKYKKCREIYSRLWENGRSVLQLTVAA